MKALKRSLTQQKEGRKTRSDIAEFTIRGDARVQETDKSFRETRRQPAVPYEPGDHAVAHVCQHMNLRVVLRCGIGEHRNSEAVDDIEQETETETLPSATEAKDRETQGSRTTPWQSIPISFLGISRPSCGKQPHWRRHRVSAVNDRWSARSSAKVTRGRRRLDRNKRMQKSAGRRAVPTEGRQGSERADLPARSRGEQSMHKKSR